jgi:hypothetical protein
MKKLLPLLALAFCLNAKAQITFETKTSQCNINNVQQTKNGGYIVFGSTTNLACLVKMDSIGDTLWTKKYKAIGAPTGLSNMNLTKDGGYIMTGAVDSLGAGSSDIILIKTNAMGNVLWSKTYGGSGKEYAYYAQQTTDGGYMIAGKTNSFGTGNYDIYLIKTDSLGAIQWTKTYGGTSDKTISSAQQTTDGGYIICGLGSTIFLIKTNAIGDTLWTKNYYSSSSALSGGNCQQTTDGGYIVSGNLAVNPSQFFSDVFYFKTDANGQLVWSRNIHTSWGTCTNTYATISQIKQFNDKGYMFYWNGAAGPCGGMGSPPYYEGGSFVAKTDSMGNTIWARNVNDFMSSYQTSDSGYVLAVNINGYPYIIKANKMGTTVCSGTGGVAGESGGNIVAYDTPFAISSGGVSANAPIQVINTAVTFTNTCSSSVDIKQNVAYNNQLNIYPNPAQNNFTVEVSSIDKQTISIFDVNGKQVLSQTITGTTNIDASNLSAGVYNLSVTNSEGVTNKRLVIVK